MLNWIGKVTFVDFTYPHCLLDAYSNPTNKSWRSIRININLCVAIGACIIIISTTSPAATKTTKCLCKGYWKRINTICTIHSPLWLATNGYPVSAIRICEICSRYGFGILINICRKNITAWCYLNVAKQNIWCAWESHRKQYRHRISGKSPLLLCSYCNVSPI